MASSIFIVRTALTFWGRPLNAPLTVETEFDRKHPPTQREKEIIERWHSFPQEQREAALARTLQYFVGGTLKALKVSLEREPVKGLMNARAIFSTSRLVLESRSSELDIKRKRIRI